MWVLLTYFTAFISWDLFFPIFLDGFWLAFFNFTKLFSLFSLISLRMKIQDLRAMTNAAEHRPVILINARLKVLFLAPIFSSNLFHEIVVWFTACFWDCKYRQFCSNLFHEIVEWLSEMKIIWTSLGTMSTS